MPDKLKYDEARKYCNPNEVACDSAAELPESAEINGQGKALLEMDFGMSAKIAGVTSLCSASTVPKRHPHQEKKGKKIRNDEKGSLAS